MSHYLDTSALIAALVHEPHSPHIRAWLGDRPAGSLFISRWVITEVHSALSVRVRTGTLPQADKPAVLAAWRRFMQASLTAIPIEAEHFDAAAAFADNHALGIRAGDALHLAVAASAGLRLVTLDNIMARAAPELGIPVEPI